MNADLSACASIPSYGWCERERSSEKTKISATGDKSADSNTTLSEADVSQILVDFQKTHPNIKLESHDENSSISVRNSIIIHTYSLTSKQTQFISSSLKLKFHINIEREANGRYKLIAKCAGASEPFLAITRCIVSRPKSHDLGYLLVRLYQASFYFRNKYP